MITNLMIEDSDERVRESNKLRDECTKKVFKFFKVTRNILIMLAVIQIICAISNILLKDELSILSFCSGCFAIVALIICYLAHRSARDNATLAALS